VNVIAKLVAVTTGSVLVAVVSAVPASARVLEHDHFNDSGSEPFTECAGIDATVSWDDDVHLLVKTKRSGGLVYFGVNVHGTTAYTNNDTGMSYSNVYNFRDRDHVITDNGDGTLTITVRDSGANRWYDSDGSFLFISAGSFAFQFMVDHGGTPNDPSDDVDIPDSFVELSFHGIDTTAGRDFCEDLALFTS
jgi:hypothetical protein